LGSLNDGHRFPNTPGEGSGAESSYQTHKLRLLGRSLGESSLIGLSRKDRHARVTDWARNDFEDGKRSHLWLSRKYGEFAVTTWKKKVFHRFYSLQHTIFMQAII
jgi:hypothetical protein